MARSMDADQLVEEVDGVFDDIYALNNPQNDIINEEGVMGLDLPYSDRRYTRKGHSKLWKLNHHEAAIYLQEGENNDKFFTHPQNHAALPAYELAHNHYFYAMDLLAAILVLLLAACERPAVDKIQLPVGVHGSLEIFGLLILTIELGIRLKWLGVKVYIHHMRTMIKTVVLTIMLIEAIVVLIRQQNHFRVTRALRPIFLLNTHYSRGVRRIARQMLQSLPPIVDMLGLLIFIMLIFSILGFYLFSGIPNCQYFSTIQDSFISLFILLTTANYPDVMMPAYNDSAIYAAFFIAYLAIELYFVMNLLLAVVYDTFSGFEKKKLKKLFLHKREGCNHAFQLLVTRKDKCHINIRSYRGVMAHFRPNLSRKEVYLTFKALNTKKNGKICLEEFYKIYDICDIKWKDKGSENELWCSWRNRFPKIQSVFRALCWLSNWRWFDYFIYVVISINCVVFLAETIMLSATGKSGSEFSTSLVFVTIYCIEVIIKLLGKGPKVYLSPGWDLFDFLVTFISLCGIVAESLFGTNFTFIIILRLFRLLRIFKIKQRYRDVLGTVLVLMNRLTSLIVVISLVYYFFAIIGIEMFLNVDLTNCCKNTSVEAYYEMSNSSSGYYYLNNFNNIFISGVTLFELTVVNNWYIIMEGYAKYYSEWSRIYFMTFYIVMMVVMTIVVAFILELFLFRIAYRRQMQLEDMDDHEKFRVEIKLCMEEERMCENDEIILTGYHIERQSQNPDIVTSYVYKGEKKRSKEDYSLRMYSDEVKTWISEEQESRLNTIHGMDEMRTRGRSHNSQIA